MWCKSISFHPKVFVKYSTVSGATTVKIRQWLRWCEGRHIYPLDDDDGAGASTQDPSATIYTHVTFCECISYTRYFLFYH